ncbi:MAG: SUMF1/EgtB/PvdO family nonheme iron enzyme [Chloroflexales bacterium]|nr:SUMF1/EgtB/PvdO family nonheme iron enzyme [Chloroflexales bacterium]
MELTDNVLRGGSWNNNRDNARCAYRNNNNPDNDNDNNGFRLATRAPRSPEMRRDALIRSGGRGAEAVKENDRSVPGSPLGEPNITCAAPRGRRPPADAWSGAAPLRDASPLVAFLSLRLVAFSSLRLVAPIRR